MEKLNYLILLAEEARDVGALMDSVDPEAIIAIAEAFRALEQRAEAAEAAVGAEISNHRKHAAILISERGLLRERAEAAEAKLAELDKQEPVAYWHHSGQVVTREECHDDKIFSICCKVERPLFIRPAPAINLAELVPDGWKIVPVEMTKNMWLQAHTLCDATCPDCGKGFAVDVTENVRLSWEGMLASAPSPSDTL